MTWRIQHKLDLANLEEIEEHIYALNPSPWTLSQDKPGPLDYSLEGYFESQESAVAAYKDLQLHCPCIQGPLNLEKINDQDWQNAYKAFLKPWVYGVLHWVPLWQKETYALPSEAFALWVDAGMAFGTGAHETTQLCGRRIVEFWQQYPHQKQARIIDAGCGSGILALSAALLGFKDIFAFDNDPDVIPVCEENAQLNGLDNRVIFQSHSLEEGLAGKKVELLMANIQTHILLDHTHCLLKAVQPEGQLVLSGILSTELEGLQAVFEKEAKAVWGAASYRLSSRAAGEWSDLCLERLA